MSKLPNLSPEAKVELKELLKQTSAENLTAAFKAVGIVIKDTPNKLDDLLLPILPKICDIIIDKLNLVNEALQEEEKEATESGTAEN